MLQRRVFLAGIGGAASVAMPPLASASTAAVGHGINVRDYGAVGDGVADDAPGVQAAIRAAEAMAPRGFVSIPQGVYRLNSGLVFTQHSTGLIGDHNGTWLNYDGDDADAIKIACAGATRLENLRLTKTGGSGVNGIVFGDAGGATTNYQNALLNVTVRDFTTGKGVDFSGSECGMFDGVNAMNCGVGFYCGKNPSGGGGAINNVFQRCRAQSCRTFAWDIDYCDGTTFMGCQALLSGTGEPESPQFLVRGGCRGNIFWALDLENPTGTPYKGIGLKCSGSEHIVNLFSYGLDCGVYLSAATGCVVFGGKYSSVTNPVQISASSTGNIILDANSAVITDAPGVGRNFVLSGLGQRSPQGSTDDRPSASSAGVGAMWFDTTLSKPIWSDGSAWRDALGAPQ